MLLHKPLFLLYHLSWVTLPGLLLNKGVFAHAKFCAWRNLSVDKMLQLAIALGAGDVPCGKDPCRAGTPHR